MRPSRIVKRIATSFASMRRRLSSLSAAANRSNTATFCKRMFFERIEPSACNVA